MFPKDIDGYRTKILVQFLAGFRQEQTNDPTIAIASFPANQIEIHQPVQHAGHRPTVVTDGSAQFGSRPPRSTGNSHQNHPLGPADANFFCPNIDGAIQHRDNIGQ